MEVLMTLRGTVVEQGHKQVGIETNSLSRHLKLLWVRDNGFRIGQTGELRFEKHTGGSMWYFYPDPTPQEPAA